MDLLFYLMCIKLFYRDGNQIGGRINDCTEWLDRRAALVFRRALAARLAYINPSKDCAYPRVRPPVAVAADALFNEPARSI